MMPTTEFEPLGRRTSRIGLGCAQLVGRSTLREAVAIVETALDLGIRYFDVAPSYGMGTAEEVLGQVIGDASDVVVATKVGIPRGQYSARTNSARKYLKPLLDRSHALKTVARKAYARSPTAPAARPHYDFSPDAVRSSLDASLQLLRRSQADVFLAHEPYIDDLSSGLAKVFAELQDEGGVGTWGVGIGERSRPWCTFGRVWQSGWPVSMAGYEDDTCKVFHGVMRYADRTRSGGLREAPQQLLRRSLDAAPGAVLLVSASNPARLRSLLRDIAD